MSNEIDPTNCSLADYLAFSEHLVQKGLAATTISNHLSAVNTFCKWLGTNDPLWQTDHWRWMHRGLALSVRTTPKLQTAVSFTHFKIAISVSDSLDWLGIKMSFILGFLGLLRVSNLAVNEGNNLDPSRHTLFQDCHLSKTSLTINPKWSKGNQMGTDVITLPRTKEPLLCPVTNWQQYVDSLRPLFYRPDWPWLIHHQVSQVFWPSRRDVSVLHSFVWEMAHLTAAAYTPHSLHHEGGQPSSQRVGCPSKTSNV